MVSGVDIHGVPFDINVDSSNVSRTGVAFSTELELAMGAELKIVVTRPPIGPREIPPVFTQGKVVRNVPSKSGQGFDIGIELTGPKLRMFSAE
jgi:hypothetical protein